MVEIETCDDIADEMADKDAVANENWNKERTRAATVQKIVLRYKP